MSRSLSERHVKKTEEKKPAIPLSNLIACLKFVDVGSKNIKVLINFKVFFHKRKIIYCSIDACVNQIITVIYFVA